MATMTNHAPLMVVLIALYLLDVRPPLLGCLMQAVVLVLVLVLVLVVVLLLVLLLKIVPVTCAPLRVFHLLLLTKQQRR